MNLFSPAVSYTDKSSRAACEGNAEKQSVVGVLIYKTVPGGGNKILVFGVAYDNFSYWSRTGSSRTNPLLAQYIPTCKLATAKNIPLLDSVLLISFKKTVPKIMRHRAPKSATAANKQHITHDKCGGPVRAANREGC